MTNAQTVRKAESKHEAKPALIVLGIDEKGRSHAARFDAALAAAATSAANLMQFSAATVTAGGLFDLAGQLPQGKLFAASGKALIPFVRAELFDQLVKVSGVKVRQPLKLVKAEGSAATTDKPGAAPAKPTPNHFPADWASIKVGSEVLAVDDDPTEGWFEAVVTTAKPNDGFELRWRDYPTLPPFTRPRSKLALLWAGPVKA